MGGNSQIAIARDLFAGALAATALLSGCASDGGGAKPKSAASASTAPASGQKSSASAPRAGASANVGNQANARLRINDAGLQLIKESEGLRLEAYSAGGKWLIGYGHSGADIRAGTKIDEAEAAALLRKDVGWAEDAVKRYVLVPVNENEFSAMVSLAYNLGAGGYSRSSVVEKLNKGDRKGAADAFLNHNLAGGVTNPHLTSRRAKERALFLKPA